MADPCTYVELEDYDWALITLFIGERGQCHGVSLAWNWTVICLLVAMHAVSIWIGLGLVVQTGLTFKTWKTWYFWQVAIFHNMTIIILISYRSMLLTACGIILYVVVIDILWFSKFGNIILLGSVFYYLAGLVMNIGFLMVLWSRLHLILDRPRVLKALLIVILGFLLPLQIILIVGSTGRPQRETHYLGEAFWHPAVWMDGIYPIAEVLLTLAYIVLFVRFWLQGTRGLVDAHIRQTLIVMILAETFAMSTDITIIGLWYTKTYLAKVVLSPFIYALKLKIEFLVLNRLTSMSKRRVELRHITISNAEGEIMSANMQHGTPAVAHADKAQDGQMLSALGTQPLPALGGAQTWQQTSDSHRELGEKSAVVHEDSREEPDGLDDIDRQYLGRFGKGSDMV